MRRRFVSARDHQAETESGARARCNRSFSRNRETADEVAAQLPSHGVFMGRRSHWMLHAWRGAVRIVVATAIRPFCQSSEKSTYPRYSAIRVPSSRGIVDLWRTAMRVYPLA